MPVLDKNHDKNTLFYDSGTKPGVNSRKQAINTNKKAK
jgi:hypothetical protein